MCISTEFPGDGLGPARPPTWENYKVNRFFSPPGLPSGKPCGCAYM